jgi:phosphoribosylaminoimidazole-succinocarboxamide synthase
MRPAVMTTDLPGALSRTSGKVRDIYDFGDVLLIVATDRISAFDVIMANGIPDKGKVLTSLSAYWFARTAHIVPNHVISTDVADFPEVLQPFGDLLAGRSMLVKKAQVVPIECVVRGYLAGSGWREYQESGRVCGVQLPEGLRQSERLPEPIFTPATKAQSGHDENISVERAAEIVGVDLADRLRAASLAVFEFASAELERKGFLLADTKFEFGVADDGLILVDECVTPDSSRFWDAAKYEVGRPQEAFDKQYVRDYLETLDWNKEPPGPALPDEVVARTREIYLTAHRRIVGRDPEHVS